nr:MAG TPA: hypothetical protein [Caudoviricetes sp.]
MYIVGQEIQKSGVKKEKKKERFPLSPTPFFLSYRFLLLKPLPRSLLLPSTPYPLQRKNKKKEKVR